MAQPRIRAVYRVAADERDVSDVARAIAFEQTVELPERLVTDPAIIEGVVGSVAAIVPDPDIEGASRVTIDYATALASGQIPQLVNLLFGNVSTDIIASVDAGLDGLDDLGRQIGHRLRHPRHSQP